MSTPAIVVHRRSVPQALSDQLRELLGERVRVLCGPADFVGVLSAGAHGRWLVISPAVSVEFEAAHLWSLARTPASAAYAATIDVSTGGGA